MPHNWLLTFEPDIPDQLRGLPNKDRMAVFVALARLLEAENPMTIRGVRQLVESRFEGQWRQRQGDYRIFFELHSGDILHQGFAYKGRFHLVAVRHRSRAY